ncbi:hypothetical protein LXL04_006247 [Taraxacum kok-saghyz]
MESSSSFKVKVRRKCYIPGAIFGPFSFINIYSGKKVVDAENGMKNMIEVAVTLRILQLLYKECSSSKQKISIAVLSPNLSQLQSLQQKIEIHYENNEFLKVKVGFFHDYKGTDDVVLVSTVGSDGDERYDVVNINGYLKSERRCLWILGDERVLQKGGSKWEPLILEAKARRCFFQADEHKDLAKVIVEVKKDLDELDELLIGESSLFKSTTWKVLFSSKFVTSFSNIESWETKKLVLLMLRKLSSGWRPKQSSTAACIVGSPYFELMREFRVKGLHILCTIDIVKDSHYVQALKVWDILPFNEMGELIRRLEGIIGTYSREYIDYCKARCGQSVSEYPLTWPATSKITQYKFHKTNSCEEMFTDWANRNKCVENVKVHESLILMKFYSFSSGAVNSMISGCDGGGIGLPLELTEQEKDVVSFDKSSFILGRSGTGKTTVLTTKLYRNEQLHHLACEGFHESIYNNEEVKQDGLRQLFVTLSPRLCYAVKKHVCELKRLTCGGSSSSQITSPCIDEIDKTMSSEDIPDHFIHLPHKNYPLIITFHRFLLMLDGTVGILSREDYVALCDGRTSILDEQKREIIYSIFEQYENIKTEKGNFDLGDLVNDLHQRLEFQGYNGDFMDYVYIDEVQDLTMRQIMLFKHVCTNVHEGYAFSGDTAQGIAKGIGFRFEDIRLLFYSKFLLGSEKGKMSKIFQLSDNFRTHSGVLNLAHSVISLICHFFPMFIDALRQESSRVIGELPILLEIDANDNVIKKIFGSNGDGTCQRVIGFGAEQVILVRDECLKNKVVDIVGKNALVLTIMESKGLEFRDVLLYDFFTSSSFSNEWRIIYEYMEENDLVNLSSCFDMEKHVVLCSELKQLYVAITRTKQRLWISETTGFSHPMFDYWKKSNLVVVKHLNDLRFDQITQTPSTKDEWRSQGVKLYYENNFMMAQMCFLKAGDKYSERLAEAQQLRTIADGTHDSQIERNKLFKESAEIFVSLGKHMLAADCFFKTGDKHFERLAEAHQLRAVADGSGTHGSQIERKKHYREAGEVFGSLGKHMLAAECFFKIGDEYFERLAEAHEIRAMADGAHVSEKERKTRIKEVGELFGSLGKHVLAAECFYEIEDYRIAGEEYIRASMLKKAGNCFFLAQCYEKAVEAYEKLGDFAKCLSVYADGKLFEMGFQLMGSRKGFREAKLEFLKRGAGYYFSIKDFKNMMKFVRSFHSKGDMHTFLIKRRCYDELISLEIEWGNYKEASKIARLKPDPVLESELLLKAGLHMESSLVILWHVFSQTVGFQRGDDYEDEHFAIKDELLAKAVSIAEISSCDVFYRFVCRESELLSEAKNPQEEVFKKGLEFIDCYKENGLASSLDGVKTTHEIDQIEKNVLHEMHTFFQSGNRVHELLFLLEVRGKFLEAETIGNEDDRSIKAALSRLWHVFLGSLCACGKIAWKLECTPDSHDSPLMRILSTTDISICERYMSEIPKERSVRLHFQVSRRIIDLHLHSDCTIDDTIETLVDDVTLSHLEIGVLKNVASIESLIHFWSYWKKLIMELITWTSKRRGVGKNCTLYDGFICDYFGVWKYDGDKNRSYYVLDVGSNWVKEMNPYMRTITNRHLHMIHAREFASVASRHWCSELLLVSEKVLKKLRYLHASSNLKKLSTHQRMKILINLFKVTEYLKNCKFVKVWWRARVCKIVDQSRQFCMDKFISSVFCINWKHSQSKEMMFLRGDKTFLNMLNEAVNVINSSPKMPTSRWHLGRITTIFLSDRKIDSNDIMRKVQRFCSLNWKELFDKLINGDKSSLKNVDLAISLHNVLKETTLYANWLRADDCMSPACFLYLIERLLILSLFFRGGYAFMTRSSCVEWLAYEEWGMGGPNGVKCLDIMNDIHHSLVSMITQMLNSHDDLLEWVTRSKEEPYDILVLRLIILLSMICVNTGQHCHRLLDILGRPCISSVLPSTFVEGIIKGLNKDCLVDSLVDVCGKIDNPLVIVSFTKDSSMAPCEKVVFLNLAEQDFTREMLMKMLY